MSDERPAQQLEILKLYLKDASLESPQAPGIFREQVSNPTLNVQIASKSTPVAEDVHEVVLNLTITAKAKEQTLYLTEIQQAGLFAIRGLSAEQLQPVLGVFCPTTLFPFAREAAASLIGKAGFTPVLLNPVNFEAIYQQRLQKEQQKQQEKTKH